MLPGGENERPWVYTIKTLRSALFVVGFISFVLAAYGQGWAIGPLVAGFGLSAGMLAGMEWFVRRIFAPQMLRDAGDRKNQAVLTAAVVFALIKYPLVGLLLWWIIRNWQPRSILAFIAGFALLHLVMGLRAMGRLLTGADQR